MSDITPGLSIAVPAHNNGPCLRETLQQLVRELDRDDVEAIIAENGSSGDTWGIVEELAPDSWGFPVQIPRSEVGPGTVYLKGASEVRGEVVLLTIDDFPLGVTDIRSWEPAGDLSALVVDSKAHPGSVVPRSKLRAVMSWGYRFLRRVILGMTVGDCQGTLFVDRTWLQRHIPLLREHSYLASIKIAHLAQVNWRRVVETPVVLQAGHERGGTWIKIADVQDMAVGLVRFRQRCHMLRTTFKES